MVSREEKLRIIRSSEGSAPRGQYVEEVWEGAQRRIRVCYCLCSCLLLFVVVVVAAAAVLFVWQVGKVL